MNNKAILARQLEKQGQAEHVINKTLSLKSLVDEFTLEDVEPAIYEMTEGFLAGMIVSLRKARELGMLTEYFEEVANLKDTDGSKTAGYLMTNLAPKLLQLPDLVEKELLKRREELDKQAEDMSEIEGQLEEELETA